MILPFIKLTKADTKQTVLVRADLVRGCTRIDESDPERGAKVDIDGAAHPVAVSQTCETIAGALNASIEWTQNRVVAAQMAVMQEQQRAANGVVVARANLNGHG